MSGFGVTLRRASPGDREGVIEVESQATPNLSYLPEVFDLFVTDDLGEFLVAEVDGELVACGKYTILPDGSAWLETLRVKPEYQGEGIGKRFYKRFFEIAQRQDVGILRMYTGVNNVVSKGLAESFGFRQAARFKEAKLPLEQGEMDETSKTFKRVEDWQRAASLLLSRYENWGEFLVLNRTFYEFNHATCSYLGREGMVYEDPTDEIFIALGARFMPERGLHIPLFGVDMESGLEFAINKGIEGERNNLTCLFPYSSRKIQRTLKNFGFNIGASDLLVMEVEL
jgi:ribosomal protein S18 acetylase RimI-like enzyme